MGLISKFRNSERETSEAPNPFELPINEAEVRRAEALPESEAMAEAEKAADDIAGGRMVLRTDNLVKKYGKRTVVNHVSIDVTQGEIVGLLGPNGAGKTTTFYMTVGLIHAQ